MTRSGSELEEAYWALVHESAQEGSPAQKPDQVVLFPSGHLEVAARFLRGAEFYGGGAAEEEGKKDELQVLHYLPKRIITTTIGQPQKHPAENVSVKWVRRRPSTAVWQEEGSKASSRVLPKALAVLDLASLVSPRRVREEEIGDTLEDIHRRLCLGHPPWKIYLRVASALFWVAINSLREITGALLGRSKAGTRG